MKRTSGFAIALLFSVALQAQEPSKCEDGKPCLDVRPCACTFVEAKVPECNLPAGARRTWTTATACLDAIVNRHRNLVPGAVIGYQEDGREEAYVHATGAGFRNSSVATLGSVSKPLVYVGLVKLIQDHYASSACTPMTSKCVFPHKFETLLEHALGVLDAQNGTDVLTKWYLRDLTDDHDQQLKWKHAVKIRHIAEMTGGWPPIAFTGYRFCLGGVCPPTAVGDRTCHPDVPVAEGAPNPCRHAWLFNQYLDRRGGADAILPVSCRPRPATGPRLFDFCGYYDGLVAAPGRLERAFERRNSHEPGSSANACSSTTPAAGAGSTDARPRRVTSRSSTSACRS